MKQMIQRFWLAVLLVLPLSAQEAEQPEVRAARGRLAYFIYTSMPEGMENPVSIMTGKDISELTLSKRMASEGVKIPADGIVRVVRKLAAPPAPGELPYQILAQTIVPENVTKALIILIPIKPTGNGILFQCKVQDLAAFKGGDYLYMNLTNLNVAVEMGPTKIPVKPGETKIYDSPVSAEPTNIPIRYSYFDTTKEEWNVLSASTVVLYGTRREICIFSWDTRYNRIDYHGITFPVTD